MCQTSSREGTYTNRSIQAKTAFYAVIRACLARCATAVSAVLWSQRVCHGRIGRVLEPACVPRSAATPRLLNGKPGEASLAVAWPFGGRRELERARTTE